MIRRPPRSTRTDTLFPYTALFRSGLLRVKSSYCGSNPAVTVKVVPHAEEARQRRLEARGAGHERSAAVGAGLAPPTHRHPRAGREPTRLGGARPPATVQRRRQTPFRVGHFGPVFHTRPRSVKHKSVQQYTMRYSYALFFLNKK